MCVCDERKTKTKISTGFRKLFFYLLVFVSTIWRVLAFEDSTPPPLPHLSLCVICQHLSLLKNFLNLRTLGFIFKSTPTWCQFHQQHTTYSFCTRKKIQLSHQCLFMLLGSMSVKAVCRTLMKLSPDDLTVFSVSVKAAR